MPLMRPRFTVRRLMVAVGVAAIGMGSLVEIGRRRDRFARLAARHQTLTGCTYRHLGTGGVAFAFPKGGPWHDALARKYRHAARYPFLPVPPDPPEPR